MNQASQPYPDRAYRAHHCTAGDSTGQAQAQHEAAVSPGQVIAVWFSCGAASAVAAKLTIERYSATNPVHLVNNPVEEEDPDNRRFLADVSAWLGVPIRAATNRRFPNASAEEVWEREKFMSGPAGAPCTKLLKKAARQQYEAENRIDWHVFGFTADKREVARHANFTLTERTNVLPVLIDAGLTKSDCFSILAREGLAVPMAYIKGYPNANCIGCVKATSPTYWNHVRTADPEVFSRRAEQSRRIGARLVRHQGKRIFLDELPPDAKGRPMQSMDIECGIFCEERPPARGAA